MFDMVMGSAELTVAKLNSVLGGVGAEWGSDQGPSGAVLPAQVRSQARQLSNSGQTSAAAELLLRSALSKGVHLPGPLLAEIEQNFAGPDEHSAAILSTVAALRAIPAGGGAAGGKKGGLFSRLFGRG